MSGPAKASAVDRDKELFNGAWRGEAEQVRAAIMAGGDLAKIGENGFTPLMIAARHGRVEAMQVLIGAGADVRKKIRNVYFANWSAAMMAAAYGHARAALTLLQAGADPFWENSLGECLATAFALGKGMGDKDDEALLSQAIAAAAERRRIEDSVPWLGSSKIKAASRI